MKAHLSISKNRKKLYLNIDNIKNNKINENAKGYYLLIHRKKLKLRIEVSSVFKSELNKRRFQIGPLKIQRNKKAVSFNVKIELNPTDVYQGIKNQQYHFELNINEGIQVKGQILMRKQQLASFVQLSELKGSTDSNSLGKDEESQEESDNKKSNRKISLPPQNELQDKRLVNKQRKLQKTLRNRKLANHGVVSLSGKGISHSKKSYEKCDNCYYFRANRCSFHLVTVTKHHTCFKHRRFREVYGGGFSPR